MAKEKPRSKSKKKIAIKRKGVTKSFIFTGVGGKKYTITLKQKLFCEHYSDPFMSGADAVIEAGYSVQNSRGVINRNSARNIAYENLMKLDICAYLSVLYDNEGLSDAGVDKQMSYNINQFKDLNAKNTAIREYNKIRGRHAPEEIKHEVTHVETVKYDEPAKGKDNKTTT